MAEHVPSVRVQVKPLPLGHYAGSFALIVLAALVGGVALWLVIVEEERVGGSVLLGLATVFSLIAVFNFARRATRRMSLEADGNGIIHARPGRVPSRIDYAETTSIAVREKEKLNNGVRVGMVYKLMIAARTERLRVEHFARQDQPNPFDELCGRMVNGVADTMEARIARGQKIDGEGWSLSHSGLTFGRGERTIPLDTVTTCGIFDSKVALWRSGEELPFFRVSSGSKNACVLLAIASRIAAKRPDEVVPADQLGRLLFRKRASRGLAFASFTGGCLLLATVVGLLVNAPISNIGDALIALVVSGVGIAMAAWGLNRFVKLIACPEAGVVVRSLRGRRRVFFRDVDVFAINMTRVYHNGAYAGTNLSMKLVPKGEKPCRFSTLLAGSDADLDTLRDHIARVVAHGLHERLQAGLEIRWGKSARITPSAIHGFAPKPLGRHLPTTVPIVSGLRYSIQNGIFSLLPQDGTKPTLTLRCSEDNFFPGLLLFGELVAQAEERSK